MVAGERSLSFSAPAKVNLNLRVVGRRADGYHLLDSVMTCFPAWSDTLTFCPDGEGIEVISRPEVVTTMQANLVWKAAARLRQIGADRGLRPAGVRIELTKRIPVAAGLGGGSSDAATTLLVLNRWWAIGLDMETLAAVALELGADLPFFVRGQAARAQGVGERLTPLPSLPLVALVLVNPGVALSTGEVFRAYAREVRLTTSPGEGYLPPVRAEAEEGLPDRNDLEAVASMLSPPIREAAMALRGVGARRAVMTGSGPTVLGWFQDLASAEVAAESLRQQKPLWRMVAGVTDNCHPFNREWPPEAGSAIGAAGGA